MNSSKKKIVIVFPGQGSQAVQMLSALSAAYPCVQETFQEASDALHYDLWKITQEGPEEKLNQTQITQPALLTASVAVWRVLTQFLEGPFIGMAGHSLGEYSALVCGGAIDLPHAVQLVQERGRLMQDAIPKDSGAMAAILGLADEIVEKLCQDISREQGIVEPANYNTPGQVVIAGHSHAVQAAIIACKNAGAKRALILPVSVPSHCSLMGPAATKFDIYLKAINFQAPKYPIWHNADLQRHASSSAIKEALIKQFYKPVNWVKLIQVVMKEGVEMLLECGPGQVLTNLNKRIVSPEIQCISINEPTSLQKLSEGTVCL